MEVIDWGHVTTSSKGGALLCLDLLWFESLLQVRKEKNITSIPDKQLKFFELLLFCDKTVMGRQLLSDCLTD